MTASMRMPMASVVARIFTSVLGTVESAMNDRNRMRAAEVTRRPVLAMPSTTARSGVVVLVVGLAHPGEDEDLVVHGQPEQEGEGSDRYPGGDDSTGFDAEQQLRPVAFLPDQHGCAVGRGDRDDVEDQRFDREPERSQGAGKKQERHHGHGKDDPDDVVVHGFDEVSILRGAAADIADVAGADGLQGFASLSGRRVVR